MARLQSPLNLAQTFAGNMKCGVINTWFSRGKNLLFYQAVPAFPCMGKTIIPHDIYVANAVFPCMIA